MHSRDNSQNKETPWIPLQGKEKSFGDKGNRSPFIRPSREQAEFLSPTGKIWLKALRSKTNLSPIKLECQNMKINEEASTN